jgi:hypothetical protein
MDMKRVIAVMVLALSLFVGNQLFVQSRTAYAYEKSFVQDGVEVIINFDSMKTDAGKHISYLDVDVLQRPYNQGSMDTVSYRYVTSDNSRSWYCYAVSKDTGRDKGSGVVRQGSYQKRILDDCLLVLYD